MGKQLAKESRRDLIRRVRDQYQKATWSGKRRIIDELLALCEYDRKYLIRLLNHPPSKESGSRKSRNLKYDNEFQQVLYTIWYAANQICSKRLVPFLPELINNMESHGHLSLSAKTRKALLTVSHATVDRLLQHERHRIGKSPSTTRAGNLLKHQIQIRTFADWDDVVPGFFEVDLVAHCGGDTQGAFLNTLVLIDVSTGWLEFMAMLQKNGGYVIAGLDVAKLLIPFPLLGIDSDNGSEFINQELISYCKDGHITFTRGRAYKKNDQAYVEEKNGSVVRRIIGYDRYEGVAAWRALSKLYRVLRLYVNFFQPSLKLLDKHREGGHVTKHYKPAQTPYQRVMESDINTTLKKKLTKQYKKLDAVKLLEKLHCLQEELWCHATLMDQRQADEPITTQRFYRKAKKPRVPHTWRTRKDPFESVTEEIDILLTSNPTQSAAEILRKLVEKYPDQFRKGHIRSMQRRVKEWRQCKQDCSQALMQVMLPVGTP